jgi:hypothetical protein
LFHELKIELTHPFELDDDFFYLSKLAEVPKIIETRTTQTIKLTSFIFTIKYYRKFLKKSSSNSKGWVSSIFNSWNKLDVFVMNSAAKTYKFSAKLHGSFFDAEFTKPYGM